MNAEDTGEVWLPLMELTNEAWDDPVRIARNTEDVTSGGETYLAFPFDVNLPDEEDGQLPVVAWVAYNSNQELTELFRSVTGIIYGRIFWVLASSPDTVEIQPVDLQIRGFQYDAQKIQGSLVVQPILDAVFGQHSMDNINAPGLF